MISIGNIRPSCGRLNTPQTLELRISSGSRWRGSCWNLKALRNIDLIFWLSTPILGSAGIETVIEREDREESSVGESALCTACEMAVVWAQNQLKQKGTKERVLQYIDEVSCSIFSETIFICWEAKTGNNNYKSYWVLVLVFIDL